MNRVGYVLALSVLGLAAEEVRADGGIMRVHEVQGPFVVTIFTACAPQQNSLVDVSVMVQDRRSNDAILDATVKLMLTPPAETVAEPNEETCGPSGMAGLDSPAERFTVAATRRQASNKLLYAAPIQFNAAGIWRLQASIKRNEDAAKIACTLPVSPLPRKWIGLFPYLTLPPLLVALFAVNQRLRGRSLGKLPSPRPSF